MREQKIEATQSLQPPSSPPLSLLEFINFQLDKELLGPFEEMCVSTDLQHSILIWIITKNAKKNYDVNEKWQSFEWLQTMLLTNTFAFYFFLFILKAVNFLLKVKSNSSAIIQYCSRLKTPFSAHSVAAPKCTNKLTYWKFAKKKKLENG